MGYVNEVNTLRVVSIRVLLFAYMCFIPFLSGFNRINLQLY